MASIQDAIAAQEAQGGGDVWVKSATVTRGVAGTPLVSMARGVRIFGGFAGTEATLAERPALGRTVLDGAGLPAHVVMGAGNSRLDGFTIQNGNETWNGSPAPRGGGGMKTTSATGLVVANCDFVNNQACACGGGVRNEGGSPTFINCRFSGNLASTGAGMCNLSGATTTLENCWFEGNKSDFRCGLSENSGSGLYNSGSSPVIRDTVFHADLYTSMDPSGSMALAHGTEIFNSGGSPRFESVTVDGAAAGLSSVVENASSSATYVNSSFTRCTAGHVFLDTGTPSTVIQSTFAENGSPNAWITAVTGTTFLNTLIVRDASNEVAFSGSPTTQNVWNYLTNGLGAQPNPLVSPLPDANGDGIPEYLLVQDDTSLAFNHGDDAAITAAGLDWASLTTSETGCRDASPVDIGRHYATPSTLTCN